MNFAKSLRASILHLKSKTFTGLSFRKILGFYYKRKRQLFYYERTSSYVPFLKTPDPVSRVIFQNSTELLLLKIPQAKTRSKSTTKGCSGMLFECLYN